MKITVLTTAGCSKCDKAKEILHELQQSIDFDLEEKDLMDNPELANKHDLMVSPDIIVDGELVSQGVPDRDKLRQILEDAMDED